MKMKYIVYVWLVVLLGFPLTGITQGSALSKKLLKTKNLVALSDDDANKLEKLLEKLDDDEDVSAVYTDAG